LNQRDCVLGVDVGGTHIRMGIVDDSGTIVSDNMRYTKEVSEGESTLENLISLLEGFVHESGFNPRGISIGFPSVVSKDRKTIIQTPNIRGLDNLELSAIVSSYFGIPCELEKDVNLLLRYDLSTLKIEPEDPVVGVYWGTGIGNSLWVNGTFLTGASGGAGELGHVPIAGAEELCGCGNFGCLETVASGRKLAEWAASHCSELPLDDLFLSHAEHPDLTAMVEYTAQAVASELNIIDPGVVILGGGVIRMKGFPSQELIRRIEAHLRVPARSRRTNFRFSQAGHSSGVLGAALHYFDIHGRMAAEKDRS